MNAKEFYELKINKAKRFGFPDPIFLNAEQLTNRNRVIYLAEIQAIHIPDSQGKTHHFSLKFSKFIKTNQEPYWEEVDLINQGSFTIRDKASLEKLAAYINANQALLEIDVLSKDYTSALLSNNRASITMLEQILTSKKNQEVIFDLFKEHYPELDEKILTYKLVEKHKAALIEFSASLSDKSKLERNFWQSFLEKNKWMFGLSYVLPLNEKRLDINNTADYLFQSDDGFVDIIEIKHPHHPFWQKNSKGEYIKYRDYLQISDELKGCITQSVNYIFQLEKKFCDIDWQRANGCEAPVKPTCTVIIGRSNDWGIEEKTAFRLLNDSLHGVRVITFDHLYDRADRLLKILSENSK
jgi:hypothetical protein